MMNSIDVLFKVTINNFEESLFLVIENVIKQSLLYEKIKGDFEVSVSIVSDCEIKEINLIHRGFDKPTDVLSFPLITDIKNINTLNSEFNTPLGDIIISYDTAISQSNEYNHSLKREIAFLTAHSMLHLLGYDHMNSKEEEIMLKKQEDILNELSYTRER